MNVLGVKVDNLTSAEALFKARGFLKDGKQHKIFTPNPEMLVKAQKDLYFREVLNKGDLNLCDGFGVSLLFKINRIQGADFMLELCKIAAEEGRSVYLIGGHSGAVEIASVNVQKLFSNLKIAGFDHGPIIQENFSRRFGRDPDFTSGQSINNLSIYQFDNSTGLLINSAENEAAINSINAAKPDILFVGFGMGKQEKWIFENLDKMPSVKIAMGVGGALDFISGKVRRAPCRIRQIGLEWLYRLVQEPKRFGRIFNATVKFIYYIWASKMSGESK